MALQNPPKTPFESPTRRRLLFQALTSVGWRESWLRQLAVDSARFNWTIEESIAAVADDIKWANLPGGLQPTTMATLADDGRLAAHPNVRDEFSRLTEIRDEVWAKHKSLAMRTVRRKYHTLIDLMRRQRDPSSRHHSVTTAAYVRCLKAKLAHELTESQRVSKPRHERQAPRLPISVSAHMSRSGTDGVAIVYEPDTITFRELVQKSFLTGVSIHRLIDDAVLNSLR